MTLWYLGRGWLVLGLLIFVVGCEAVRPTATATPVTPLSPPPSSPSPATSGPMVSTPVAVQTQPGTFPVAPTGQATPAFFREMPAPGPLPHRGAGTPLPFPQPGDSSLKEGPAFVAEAWLENGDTGGKAILHLQGSLPTPCHALRVHTENRAEQHQFLVRVYSVYPPDQMCAQVLQPFAVDIPLTLPQGAEVLVNGRPVPRR